MLKKLLSAEECKECHFCCCFSREDIWETPIIFEELREYITKNIHKNIDYMDCPGCGKDTKSYLFDVPFKDGEQIIWCPMLSETGCILKDNKPFDCRIWPFRMMQFAGKLVITVSPVCKSISEHSIRELSEFVQDGFGEMLYDMAEKHPEIVKPYIKDYPILKTFD